MFSFKRPKGDVVLVADMDDMSVGVSIVTLRDTGVTILASERMRLPFADRTLTQNVAAVIQLLEKCAEVVVKKFTAIDAKKAPQQPRAAYAILHAPWTRFRTAQSEELFPKRTPVTKELLAGLAKKALAQSDFDKSAILETGVMRVYLNGYPTGNPLGKHATCAGVIAYESEINQEIKRGVSEVLGKIVPGRKTLLRSGLSAYSTLLHEHMPDIHRFVVLDVGGSTTTCSVFLRESAFQNASVPEGLATILKRISSGGLLEETLTQLRMLESETCSSDACKVLKDSLARIEPDLAKIFGEAFATLAARRHLPNNAILCAPVELSPWLQGFFTRVDFSQFTATMQPLNVESLTPDHLRDMVIWNTGTPDTGIGIAAGFVHILERSRT